METIPPLTPPETSPPQQSGPLLPGLEPAAEPIESLSERLKDQALPVLTDLLIDFFQQIHSHHD